VTPTPQICDTDPPHQIRHTYATALINAGVSLQALMALLGHVSSRMSLRYAHLFDHTVRTEASWPGGKPYIGGLGRKRERLLQGELIYGPAHGGPWKTIADVELATPG